MRNHRQQGDTSTPRHKKEATLPFSSLLPDLGQRRETTCNRKRTPPISELISLSHARAQEYAHSSGGGHLCTVVNATQQQFGAIAGQVLPLRGASVCCANENFWGAVKDDCVAFDHPSYLSAAGEGASSDHGSFSLTELLCPSSLWVNE